MKRLRLLAIVSVSALVLATCGASPNGVAQTEDDSSTTTVDASPGVHVAASEHGDILVGPDGSTLYVFTADVDGASACDGACAEAWPPLAADVGLAADLDQSIFASITREDGTEQMSVNGMPLYYYAADSAPGDTSGHGLNDAWFVVDPNGIMIRSGAEETNDSIIDY